ncbi:MAG: hypothetical protein JNL11_14505 [Bdellovibrionaceae bacterium]|nr:hypothetical protein [Pseudobdellovibrionaceae bacterium]
MKKLFIFLVFGNLLFSTSALAFDTSSGTYISQQDIMILLKEIFYGDSNEGITNNEIDGCSVYKQDSSTQKPYFELGFPNLETGERMAMEPDSSYVLHLDLCVNEILKSKLSQMYQKEESKKFLGQSLYDELDHWRAKTNDDLLKTPEYLNKKIKDEFGNEIAYGALFYEMSSPFLRYVEISLLPVELRGKIIDKIFLDVFRSPALIPQEYMATEKTGLLKESEKSKITIVQFIGAVYKKAIINDYLLKY